MDFKNIKEKEGEESSLLLTLFDTNLIQNIFIKLFKIYKYELQKKSCISGYQRTRAKEHHKKYFFKMNNFKLVCSLFNNISKKTLFNLNIYNIQFKIPYNLYLTLSLVERRVETADEEEKNIDSMLIYSCENGFYDIIKTLIEQGKANINIQQYGYRDTPLIAATRNRKITTIKELFKFENLNINLKTYWHSPLMEACQKGFGDIVELFLSRNDVDPNIQDNKGFTALMYATINNNEKIVSLLLSRNDLDLNLQDNGDQWTALIFAVIYNQYEIISLLLSRNDLDPNIQDSGGYTALIYATMYKQEKVVSWLFQTNGININIKDWRQKTALDYAKERKYRNIIKILKNYEKNDLEQSNTNFLNHYLKKTIKFIQNQPKF